MKKQILSIVMMLALILAAMIPMINDAKVYAQAGGPVCYDATGAEIPCPPTDDPTGGGSGGGGSQPGGGNNGNPKPPVAAQPTFTPTSLPLAYPEDDFLGTCTINNLSECREEFTCEDGLLVIKVDLYADGSPKYDFYCIPHEDVPQLDLPLASAPDQTEGSGFIGDCSGSVNLGSCMTGFIELCLSLGGTAEESYDEDPSGPNGKVSCTDIPKVGDDIPAPQQPAPTIAPVIAVVPQEPSDPQPKPQPSPKPAGPQTFTIVIIILAMVAIPTFIKMKLRPKRQTREHVLLARQPTNNNTNSDDEISNVSKKKKIRRPPAGGPGGLSGPGF